MKVTVIDHPLVQHKLSRLRDKNTSNKEFRELVSELAMLMCYEVTRDLPLVDAEIETPPATARRRTISTSSCTSSRISRICISASSSRSSS